MANDSRGISYHIDFIGRMNAILWATLILSVLSIASLAVWGLNFGTDFAGGYELQVRFPKAVSESAIRDIIEPMHLQDARVQQYGADADNSYLILVRDAQSDNVRAQEAAIVQAMGAKLKSADDLQSVMVAESGDTVTLHVAGESATSITEGDVRALLEPQGFTIKKLNVDKTAQETVFVATVRSLADTISERLVGGLKLGDGYNPLVRVEFVGPQVGAQLRNQGLLAVVYSLLLIFVYVAVRFDTFFAPGAIIATLHDIILTLGIFSFFRIDFDLSVVAAVLTLIGYSLNDTIVVYDRIRENATRLRGMALRPLVNQSINETLTRTTIISGLMLFVVGALVVLGGPTIRPFALMMFIGVIVGTYSSIAVASPLYIALREYGERPKQAQKRAVERVSA